MSLESIASFAALEEAGRQRILRTAENLARTHRLGLLAGRCGKYREQIERARPE